MGLIAAIGVVVVSIFAYGLLYSLDVLPGLGTELEASIHETNRPIERDPVRVIEFFSYACVHCRDFESELDDWLVTLPDGVLFERKHVAFSGLNLLAKTHATLLHHNALDRNHRRIFRAIHDRSRTFTSTADIADFVDGFGIDRDAFISTMNGSRVDQIVQKAHSLAVETQIIATPMLLVGNRYVVRVGNDHRGALALVDEAVTQIMSEGSDSEARDETTDELSPEAVPSAQQE